MTNRTYRTYDEAQTQSVAEEFARTLTGGEVVFLNGDLGSGKTTFVRGVARAMGFDEPVRSPSFTIVNRYPVDHEGIKQILHIDFYRLDDPTEIPPLALDEEFGQPDTIAFIEWPERAGEPWARPSHTIHFSSTDGPHTIDIEKSKTG